VDPQAFPWLMPASTDRPVTFLTPRAVAVMNMPMFTFVSVALSFSSP
jgi:hypothetical protein